MKNTLETRLEIEAQFKQGETRATLYGQDQYDEVDWDEIARYFKTDSINGYGQGDKIVIRLPGDPDLEVPENFVKSKHGILEWVCLIVFAIGAVTVVKSIWDFIKPYLLR